MVQTKINKMKTLKKLSQLFVFAIIVKAGMLQPKTLTKADIAYLNANAPASVVRTLANYKTGGTISNNEAAEVILKMLNAKK